jgi:hypothetical protein
MFLWERWTRHRTPCRTPEDNRTRCRPAPGPSVLIENINVDESRLTRNRYAEVTMKVLSSLIVAISMLSGCISSSNPSPPPKTTVVVPQNSGTTVVCQDGSSPPCN